MAGWSTNRIGELLAERGMTMLAKGVARDRGIARGKVLRLEYAWCNWEEQGGHRWDR